MMQDYRSPTNDEMRLLQFLIYKSGYELMEQLKNCLVINLDDGKMGSLLLMPEECSGNKIFGRMVSECHFTDSDGIDVIATLNLDTDGNLFELDIWKTDFSPLKEYPKDFNK